MVRPRFARKRLVFLALLLGLACIDGSSPSHPYLGGVARRLPFRSGIYELRGGSVDGSAGNLDAQMAQEATTSVAEDTGIDEGLYSRQLYVMGKSAMTKMGKADVLISGLSGLGAEVAKNVILAGVRSVTLHDERPVRFEDLSSQFCLGEGDVTSRGGDEDGKGDAVSKGRARASLEHLQELNPYVEVNLLEGPLTEEAITSGGYRVVVLIDESLRSQLAANDACRRAGSCFISASSRGAFASLFCDFGHDFLVDDEDGEEAKMCLIGSIERAAAGATGSESGRAGVGAKDNREQVAEVEWVVNVIDGERHDLQTGDAVRFEGLEGVGDSHLPFEGKEFRVKALSPKRFAVKTEQQASPARAEGTGGCIAAAGGRAVQVKKPRRMSFLPLHEAIRADKAINLTMPTDFAKLDPGRQLTVHACFMCLDEFRKARGGRFPTPGSR
ncbi:unnamed protein product, partial [Discosporangium mesarthrocarpum]